MKRRSEVHSSGQAGAAFGDASKLSPATRRLIEQLRRLVDDASRPAMKVPLLQRLAKTLEQRADDLEGALGALAQAAALAPADRRVRNELERVARQVGDVDMLDSAWDQVLVGTEDPAQRVSLLVVLARILDEAGAHDAARLRYEQALDIEGDDVEVLEGLAGCLRREERWRDLTGALGRLAMLADDAKVRGGRFLELAEIAESHLDAPDDALAAYESAWANLGDDPRLLRALERLYRDRDKPERLAGVLERLAHLEPREGARYLTEAGRLYEERLDDPGKARAVYEQLFETRSADDDVLRRLLHLVEAEENWERVVAILERRLEQAPSDEERPALWRRLAAVLLQHVREPARAAGYLDQVLAHDPDDAEAFRDYRDACRAAEMWSELEAQIARRLERAPDDEERRRRLQDLAEIRGRLGRVDEAVEALEALIESDPEDSRALLALEDVYRERGRTDDLLRVLERRSASLVADPEDGAGAVHERARINRERADLLRKLGRLDEAEVAYRAVLDDLPGLTAAVQPLVEILLAGERRTEALLLLDSLVEQAEDEAAVASARVEKAAVLVDMDERESAVRELEAALEGAPGHRGATSALGSLHFDEQQWEAAAPYLEAELEQLGDTDDAERKAEIHRRRARCAVQIGEHDVAAQHFRAADSLVPGHLATLLGLARAELRGGDEEQARQHFESLLAIPGGEASTATGREVRLALLELPTEAERRLEIAEEVLEHHRGNRVAARARVEALLDAERWSEGAQVLEELVAATERAGGDDMSCLLGDRLRLAGILRDHVGDLAAAQEVLATAAARNPDDGQPLRALLEVQVERDDLPAALEALERLLPLVPTEAERASYHYMAAQLLADDSERAADVARHLIATVSCDLERRDALEAVEGLLTRLGDWEGLARALEMVADAARERGESEVEFHLRRRLAEHHIERTGDRLAAIEGFRRALELDDSHRSVYLQLADMLEAVGREDEAVDVVRSVLQRNPGQVEPWRTLARLFERLQVSDGVRAALGVVVLSNDATDEERERLTEHPRPWLNAARHTVPRSALLRVLRGGEGESPVTEVMRLLYENLHDVLEAPTLRSLGLGRGDEIEADRSLLFMRTMQATARVLDLEAPRVYFDEQGGGFRVLPTRPPVLAVSGGILRGRREADLAFLIGKALALVQPEFALAGMMPLAGLKALVQCVHAYLEPRSFRVPMDGPQRRRVDAVVKELKKRMDDEDRDRLAEAVKDVTDEQVAEWVRRVARQSNHLGLLCSGDLVRAARLCNRPLVVQSSYLDDRESIVDLALYSVSQEYLELRRRLWGMS